MNAVILTAVLSAGNSGLYVSARMLFSLAQEGKAPKIFTKVNKGGRADARSHGNFRRGSYRIYRLRYFAGCGLPVAS